MSDDDEGFINSLESIDMKCVAPKLPTATRTLKKYHDMISNTIEYSNLTNGPLEGLNNKIKLIQGVSFGYRNFENLRNRIILCLNLLHQNQKKRSNNFTLLNLRILTHQPNLTESPFMVVLLLSSGISFLFLNRKERREGLSNDYMAS